MQANSNWAIECRGQLFPIPPQGLAIGRGSENALALPDDQVSRRHATIWFAQGGVFIRDEDSTNGTFVNGRRIAGTVPLRAGDQIQIGRAILRVQLGGGLGGAPNIQPTYRGSSNQTWIIVAGAISLFALIVAGIALAIVMRPSAPTNIALGAPSPALALATATRPNVIFTPTGTPALIASPTVARTNTPTLAPTAVPAKDPIQVALMASVLIIVQVGTTDNAMIGSGSIIDPRGLILTNSHVVRDAETDKPFNNADIIYIGIFTAADKAPEPRFRAEIVARDRALDLAVLKINATFEGKPPPADLQLPTIPLGNSDEVQMNEPLTVIGYPGTGQAGSKLSSRTVTLTRGVVSGFAENRAWIKTDTEIGHGNSGGMAINATGKLIGVPTSVKADTDHLGNIGYIRPINLAKVLIEKVK
jgi:putative serine protease PepD